MGQSAFPKVPAAWSSETSFEQWIPDPATRATIVALSRRTAKQSPAQRRRSWAAQRKLLPPTLAAVVGDAPWRCSPVPSPDVAETAMALLRYGTVARTPAQVRRVQAALARILPELPALCLPEVVGQEEYLGVLNALLTRLTSDPQAPDAIADLLDYASDS
jgi:hypothetical protein